MFAHNDLCNPIRRPQGYLFLREATLNPLPSTQPGRKVIPTTTCSIGIYERSSLAIFGEHGTSREISISNSSSPLDLLTRGVGF